MNRLCSGMSVLIVIFITGCVTYAPPDPNNFNLVFVSVDNAYPSPHVNMPREEVFTLFGEPDHIFYGESEFDSSERAADGYHVYRDIGLSFLIQGSSVTSITLIGTGWEMSNGLRSGIRINDALAILGDSFELRKNGDFRFYNYPQYGISLEAIGSSGRVREINIGGGSRQTVITTGERPESGEAVTISFVRFGNQFGGVYFESVRAHTAGRDVVIEVEYTSDIAAGLSLYNPPDGAVVSIQNEDVRIGSGVSAFTISKSILSQAADIVIKPFGDGDGNNAIQLDTKSSEWLFLLE